MNIKPVGLVVTCAVAATTISAAFASACGAYGPNLEGEMLLTASPAPESLHTSAAARGYVSPLLAKEIAVLTNKGISPAGALQAIEVQSRVAQADLVRKLQAAMGSAYAGVWFENVVAQLYVGATSPTSRRTVARTVAQAGLAADVTIRQVRSTMAQLLTVQDRWNRKLAKLIEREDASTGLEPQRNAVSVTLSSSVSAPERAVLEREASGADVNVFVTVVKSPHLGVRLDAGECNNFTGANANCNPSVTAGTLIERPRANTGKGTGKSHKNTTLDGFTEVALAEVLVGDEVSGPGIPAETIVTAKPTYTSVTISESATSEEEAEFTFSTGARCTAGPAAIPTANRSERVLLTAGHCIERGRGVGSIWFAFKRNLEKPKIGEAIAFQNGGASGSKIGDYGDIKIEPAPGGGWQTGVANNPVLAVTARWEEAKETRYQVRGETEPTVGRDNCHEGIASGGACGEVTQLNQTVIANGRTKEGLVEDNATSATGDSGGPWFWIDIAGEVLMEGTHVGTKRNTGNALYEPLTQPVAGATPGSLTSLNLVLLTTANETIRPQFLLAEWLVGGAAVTTELSNETTGELLLEDTKAPLIGKAAILCSLILDGWVGPNSLAWVSEVLNFNKEAISTTPLSGLALECTAQSGCESSTAPKVWPVNLGWEAEVELMEDTSNFFALLSLPHSGGGNPGWEIECLVFGTTFSDECTASESIAELALEGGTLLGKLSKSFTELAEVKLAKCSQGGEEAGVFEGESSITLNGGGELTASSEGSVS